MKPNYDEQMLEILNENKGKKILLHSCCAPCSSYCIKELAKFMSVTVLYYNPNIEPIEEYNKRKQEQIRLIEEYKKTLDVSYLDCDYENETYENKIKGLEQEKEGGKRCLVCFNLRLEKTASFAKQNNYDFFATTLTVSPHKNSKILNEMGIEIGKKYKIPFLVSDFKKREGYKKSIEYSKEYNLYRQNYCGCKYAKENAR
jgi:hypothetical protein